MEQITPPKQPIPVYILLRENTLALDLIGPAEVLRYANRLAEMEGRPALFDLRYISAESRIDTSIGLSLAGFSALPKRVPTNAMLLLIGCTGNDDDFSGLAAQATVAWLRRHVKPSHRLLCICTGALLAGYAGLLDDRQCTTHHNHYDSLRKLAPRARVLENRIFVEDGSAYTSAGVTAGIDLTLHVVAQIAGYQFAAAIARTMVIYMRRAGTDPQLSPWLAFRNHLHPAIHRVQDAIIGNPSADWTIAQLAQIACSSERHLTRLFREHTGTGVVDYLHRIRIGLARELLVQSDLGIERVAEKVGFNSTRQLRRIWKKFETTPPSHYRAIDRDAATGHF
ncbi:GlxA family transcriptional regulator [Undibacterium arcticum]|uniref:GlxA family transcriptional regulator n=1 Tax=Undibacterium arcticum TaxID=1762892 RepID=A0ABV7F5I8_9BURK